MIKTYYLAKIIRKLRLSSFYKCEIDKTARTSVGCSFSKIKMGRYSYTGSCCNITDAKIGSFCSIGGMCDIGGGMHPMDHVSTSPVFLKGRNIMRTNLAELPYSPSKTVYIGNDVWIGDGVFIRAGVSIGDGSIIGAHAVVLHDVEPYTVVAGVPAKVIRKRFDNEVVEQLLEIQWWNWSDEQLKKYGQYFGSPKMLLEMIEKE